MARTTTRPYKRPGVEIRQAPPSDEWSNAVKAAFGRHLRAHREARSISQERLALRCGLDRTFISDIERGVTPPGLISLCAIAGALELAPETLLAFKIPARDLVTLEHVGSTVK